MTADRLAHLVRIETDIEIAAPPEEVFEWLVDRRLMARWCEALDRPASFADCLPEDRSELRLGYRAEVDGVARTSMTSTETETVRATYEVTEYQPPRRYGTRSVHPTRRQRSSMSSSRRAAGPASGWIATSTTTASGRSDL